MEELVTIRVCLQASNLKTPWDISNWTNDAGSLWDGQNLGEVPQWLDGEATLLLDLLQGKPPLKVSSKDKREWDSLLGSLSAVKGYKSMMVVPNIPSEPNQWKFISSFPSLPKIDFFRWRLAHKSILTRDNLRRHGMEGPSRCPLCVSDEETANHLLLMCPLAQEVWRGVLMLGPDKIELPRNILDLLRNWAKLSLLCLSKKGLLRTGWMRISKFTCWKLWLERNNRIFMEESGNPIRIITKIKALLGEAFEAKPAIRNGMILDSEEDQWLKELVPNHQDRSISLAKAFSHWEILLEE